jgi:hypothetical protein
MSNPWLEMLGRFPWTAGAFWVLALVFGLGVWLAADRWELARQGALAWSSLHEERRRDGVVPVRWTMGTLEQAEDDVLRVEEQAGRWRESLAGEFPAGGAGPAPADASEAFFDLEGFRGRMRARASELGIGLRPEEGFGFAAYTHEGPGEAWITAVHRQRQVIEFILLALLREPPVELRAVHRERPVVGGTPAAGTSDDYFVIDPQVTVRVPELIGGTAMRVVFVGRTKTLRSFLIGLGGYQLPLIVRTVEVEEAGPLRTGARPRPGDAWDDLSQFTVVVEHVQFNGARTGEDPR